MPGIPRNTWRAFLYFPATRWEERFFHVLCSFFGGKWNKIYIFKQDLEYLVEVPTLFFCYFVINTGYYIDMFLLQNSGNVIKAFKYHLEPKIGSTNG